MCRLTYYFIRKLEVKIELSIVGVNLKGLISASTTTKRHKKSIAKGKAVKEVSVCIPTDPDGLNTSYRDRMMNLFHAPLSIIIITLK
uniref:Uncharacterized protein n=1 Tax=Echinococcus canadensis TaxID=519352 RepID=A0A915EZK6_9CEST